MPATKAPRLGANPSGQTCLTLTPGYGPGRKESKLTGRQAEPLGLCRRPLSWSGHAGAGDSSPRGMFRRPLVSGLRVGERIADAGEECADGGHCGAVQKGPVDSRPERRPEGAVESQYHCVLGVRGHGDVGI